MAGMVFGTPCYWMLWFIGFATALMTSFYMFRLIYLTFDGKPRMSHEVEHHVHESPKSMTIPLMILAFFSIFAGFLGWPHSLLGSNRMEAFLKPVFSGEVHVLKAEGKAGQVAEGQEGSGAHRAQWNMGSCCFR